MRRKQEYTKKAVARTLKKIGWLKDNEIDPHPELPSRSIIVRLFRTTKIDDVWEELGIEVPTTRRRPKYTKETVSKTLKETGYLTTRDISQHPDLPAVTTIYTIFNTRSMSDIWRELGIPVKVQPTYTKEEVSKALKKTGYLTHKEIDQHPDLPACTTIRRLFQTTNINNVWQKLDISFKSKKDTVAKKLKETGWLKYEEIDKHPDLPSVSTILRVFKATKMSDVWQELGIQVPGVTPKYTKNEIAKALKKTGYLTQKEIDQHPNLPSERTIRKLFKTNKMSDAWRELNIPVPTNYTKDEVVKALKKEGYLTQKEINQHPDLPSVLIIKKLFKTTEMTEVWRELDIQFLRQPTYTKDEVAKTLEKVGYLPQREIDKHPELPVASTIRKLFETTNMSEVWKELGVDILERV